MNRGDIYIAELPGGRRPAVIVTRDSAIPLLRRVTVAGITSRRRGAPTEVVLESRPGLPIECCVSCDNLATVLKDDLLDRRGSLEPAEARMLDRALRIALDLD